MRDAGGLLESVAKAVRMRDVVIAGEHQQHRFAVLAQRVDRSEPDGRRGVSRRRLDDQMPAGQIRQRLADPVDMRPAAS